MDLFGIGSTELMVALVLALLVLGPQKLVKFARTAGKAMRRMRDMSGELTRSITDAVGEEEEKPSAKQSPDEKKKKVSPLQKIGDEIKQALTLEEEKPAPSPGSSPNEKKKVSPLQKIGDDITRALSLEEEQPAPGPGSSPAGEVAAPATEKPGKKGEDIGQSLRKMHQEINEALGDKKSPGSGSPGQTDE
ncbi:MAG: twin-arginine translocase TatA/TatE family subunit [Chloroflexi bacterium]|nr:twin-arginine translocase TatA/TatE family subunit [Chloroflexota bacterium]